MKSVVPYRQCSASKFAEDNTLVRSTARWVLTDADPDIPILKEAKAEYAKAQ
jgi:hypothetical protein